VCHKASGVYIDGTEECLTIKRVIAIQIIMQFVLPVLVTLNIVVAVV